MMKRHPRTLFVVLLLCGMLLCPGIAPAQQDRGMGVPAEDLPEDLQKLDVKDHYIPSNFREVGVIHGLNGQVVVIHRAKGEAFFGKPGDRIHENDELNTLGDSRCRIRFYSDDVVNMAPETRFAVEAFEDQREEGKKNSVFSMIKGKAMFYALRLFRYRDTRFKVKTPTAVVGVRGTKFGLDVFWYEEGKTAQGGHLRVADSGRGFDAFLAQNQGQGLRSGTRAACGDGNLFLIDPDTGGIIANVDPNEVFNSATGDKTYDPTNRTLNGIQQASQVRDGKGDEGGPPTQPAVQGGDQNGLGDDTGLPDTTYLTDAQTNITQQQTGEGSQVDGSGPSFTPFQGTASNPLYGYFAAFLIFRDTGNVKDAFLPSSIMQQMDPLDDAHSTGVIDGSNETDIDDTDASGNSTDTTLDVSLNPEGVQTDIVIDDKGNDGQTVYLGQYNYLQWGYHIPTYIPKPDIGGSHFQYLDKFWFVEGYQTCSTEIAAMSGDYTYSGVVNGTYYSKAEQVDVKGKYSSQVHFGSSYIHDFKMTAEGGGHKVEFNQSGSSSLTAEGTFVIGGGTFKIDGNDMGSNWGVNGGHFGPGAKEQGGVYGAACDSLHIGSYGTFTGTQQ